MRRWGLLRLVLLVTLGLSLAIKVALAQVDDVADDDDVWEDIEDDEEPAVSSTRSRVSPSALVQLNDKNSEKILKSNEYVMLLGYASWCRQSAAAMVHYAEAALALKAKGSPVVLARTDAIVNTVTAGRYKIKGYPTVLFFRNGSEEMYPAGLSSEEIVNWIQKQTGHATTTISTEDEAKEILKRKQTAVVVAYFDEFEGPVYEDFVAASIEVADVEFVQTTVAEVAGFFKPEMVMKVPSIGLFDSEDGFEQMDGPVTKDAIVAFVNLYKYPIVTKLYSQNVGKVYSSPMKKHVILFASEDDFEDMYDLYKSAALTFQKELMFLWVDIADEDFAKPMLTMYGIPDNEAAVAGFDNNNGFRYLLDAEVTKENLLAWAEKYLEGQLDLHYKSERIPKENSGDVKVVVGKTFSSIVLERTTDVVLLVYTPYCYDCESMGKVFLKVAKHFKGNSTLTFAKIDGSANEHPTLKVSNYPAILFYSSDIGSAEPAAGPSKPYFKRLVKFVEEQLQLRASHTNDLSKEVETSEITTEVPYVHDSVSPSLATESESVKVTDSRLTETVSADSQTRTVIDLPAVESTDAESSKAPDSEDGSAETLLNVSPPAVTEEELAVETETPVKLTVPAVAAVADSSQADQIALEEDKDVKDLIKDVVTKVTVTDNSRTDGREIAVEEERTVEDRSKDVSTEAVAADFWGSDRSTVKENSGIENSIKDEFSFKDEL